MNQKEASQRRAVIVMHPTTDEKETYYGDEVYSISDKGIVIAASQSRMLYPWHRVMLFTYHIQDETARKVILGY